MQERFPISEPSMPEDSKRKQRFSALKQKLAKYGNLEELFPELKLLQDGYLIKIICARISRCQNSEMSEISEPDDHGKKIFGQRKSGKKCQFRISRR